MRWLRNKELMRKASTPPRSPTGPTTTASLFAYSRLAVPKASWKMDDEFTCQVIHEALPKTRTPGEIGVH